MPLPGWNIDYPAGDIGELYTKILQEDGLDPKRMQRDQRYVFLLISRWSALLIISEYSLPGSYRKIIHLPKTFTWSHVSYTDPDISLVQSDEDKILGENPAAEDDPEGMSPIPSYLVFHPTFLCLTFPPLLHPFHRPLLFPQIFFKHEAERKLTSRQIPSTQNRAHPRSISIRNHGVEGNHKGRNLYMASNRLNDER